MKILLTGHRGYIGPVIATALLESGHDVVGLDTCYLEQPVFASREPELRMLRKDVRDVTAGDLEGFEAVVHYAALSNDALGDLKAEWTYEINYEASVALGRLAKSAGVSRLVYASSCSIYGASG